MIVVHGYTEVGTILATIDGDQWDIVDDENNRLRMIVKEWEDQGNVIPSYSVEVAPPPTITDYENAIQNLVDNTARERQFADGVSLASYVASTKPKWAAEAQAFVAWRDYVWTSAYAELEKVQNGEREQPSIEAIIEELPKITWPST